MLTQDQLRVHHLSIPPLQSLLNNASEIKSIVNRDLERLAMSKKQSEQNLNRTRNFLRDALEDVGNLKSSLELAGKKYVEVQEMKEYIADVTDCLQVYLAPKGNNGCFDSSSALNHTCLVSGYNRMQEHPAPGLKYVLAPRY